MPEGLFLVVNFAKTVKRRAAFVASAQLGLSRTWAPSKVLYGAWTYIHFLLGIGTQKPLGRLIPLRLVLLGPGFKQALTRSRLVETSWIEVALVLASLCFVSRNHIQQKPGPSYGPSRFYGAAGRQCPWTDLW